MRSIAIVGTTLFALVPLPLALANVDTRDVDSYLMQDMETALKNLEPTLTAGNAESALADAHVLRDGLQYTYDYFVAKGNAEDAVKIATEGQTTIARVLAAIESKDLDAAIAAARDTGRNCKACHDIYKP